MLYLLNCQHQHKAGYLLVVYFVFLNTLIIQMGKLLLQTRIVADLTEASIFLYL